MIIGLLKKPDNKWKWFLQLNENTNKTSQDFQNPWDIVKEVLRGAFIVINADIKSSETSLLVTFLLLW